MRNHLFTFKALSAILLTLLVLPCNSQTPRTTSRQNTPPAVSERSQRDGTSERTRYDYFDPIDNVRQKINASLPIVRRLSEQRILDNNQYDIERLVWLMDFQYNGEQCSYRDLVRSLRRDFTQSDFRQLFEVLIFVDKSLADMQYRKINQRDALRYNRSMNEISRELFNNNFINTIFLAIVLRDNNRRTLTAQNTTITIFREIALFRLDNSTLDNVACNDADPQVRLEAVRKITNPTTLANVACNDADPQVRLEAVRKITNPTTLANVACNDRDPQIRLEAVRKITNPTTLANVACNDRDPQVRLEALRKITNQATLVNIANSDSDPQVRIAAIQKLTNRQALMNIANNDRVDQVRREASRRLYSL